MSWSRENVVRWIEQGERDANRALASIAFTSITM
jgi:hypothetical protein